MYIHYTIASHTTLALSAIYTILHISVIFPLQAITDYERSSSQRTSQNMQEDEKTHRKQIEYLLRFMCCSTVSVPPDIPLNTQ